MGCGGRQQTKKPLKQERLSKWPEIGYSLTLHDKNNVRVIGFDNEHPVKSIGRKRYSRQKIAWDHKHLTERVTRYEFESSAMLLIDLWAASLGISSLYSASPEIVYFGSGSKFTETSTAQSHIIFPYRSFTRRVFFPLTPSPARGPACFRESIPLPCFLFSSQ